FTIDGRGAPFVDGIEGDTGTVLGLSLPVFRRLLRRLGFALPDLWANPVRGATGRAPRAPRAFGDGDSPA
ncbi:MAG TPA: hypothetical protein VMT43_07130, partial [Acidimicrobiales bacterium]|nr:hypothetical protein [Acidimicrobiales bacterium]